MSNLDLPKRKHTRIRDYDYSAAGTYFITTCLQGMVQRFGRVENGLMYLNDAGNMAHRLWIENGSRYDDVLLDAFVLMPNHLHAIVIIGSEPRERHTPTSLETVVGAFKSVSTVEYGRGVRAGTFPRYEHALWQRSHSA